MQRGLAVLIACIDVGFPLEKRLEDAEEEEGIVEGGAHGVVQHRGALVREAANIGALGEERLAHGKVASTRGAMEARPSVLVGGVDVEAEGEEIADDI